MSDKSKLPIPPTPSPSHQAATSLFSTAPPALVICGFINDGHSDWCEMVSWTWRRDLWLPDGRGREWEGWGAWAYQTQRRIDLQGDPAE